MAANTYDIRDRPIITGVFTDANGDSAAPTAVTVIVREPDGTETTYTSPDATLSVGATTTFTFPFTLDQSDKWIVRMKGTAGVECAGEIVLDVRPTTITTP